MKKLFTIVNFYVIIIIEKLLEVNKITYKEIYCMGREEYLAEYKGYTLIEAYNIAEEEWNDDIRTNT